MTDYASFIDSKTQLTGTHGFEPSELPDFLFDFQRALVTWAIRKGRCALFADCGLGKTPMQLVWADQVARHTGGRVLILAPLAVASQTVREERSSTSRLPSAAMAFCPMPGLLSRTTRDSATSILATSTAWSWMSHPSSRRSTARLATR